MKFSFVSQIFSEIEQRTARNEIIILLADLMRQATPHECELLAYLVLGTLRAPYKKTQFNMAEKLATKVVADLLETTPADISAAVRKTGDLGTVLLVGGWNQTGDPTLTNVYDSLCVLESISGSGSQEERHDALLTLLRALDPISAQFVVRIVLGKLRLGFSDMTLIDALSWMAAGDKSLKKDIEQAYTLCADIGTIARTVRADGAKGLCSIDITVGIPIRPAAAERLQSSAAIVEKLGACVAQPKLDGFRLQVHCKPTTSGTEVTFFSRNLLDMTEQFPELSAAFKRECTKACIVEGEAIVYDEETDSFLPFQETVKRKRKHGIAEAAQELPLRIFLFDLLYYDHESYLNKPHYLRRAQLEKLFPRHTHHDTISVIDEKPIKTAAELEEYFLEVVAAGLEGLIIKRPDALYQAGKRNFNWIKLKRHAAHTLEDTIDAAILGYYHGSGKRASFGIGAFLVGIYNQQEDRFETVAKVGTGLTDTEWKELKKRCDTDAVAEKPHNVLCSEQLAPDVWVYPTTVCTIQAEEITRSPTHSAGLALRFPRFQTFREDKSPTEATSRAELKHLFAQQREQVTEE